MSKIRLVHRNPTFATVSCFVSDNSMLPVIYSEPKYGEELDVLPIIDRLANKSWIEYNARRSYPASKSKADKLRWWLRCKLVAWRII